MPISEERAERIELKLDEVAKTLNKMEILADRQIESGKRVGQLEDRMAKSETLVIQLEKKLDRWVNMGVGIWGFVGFGLLIYQTFKDRL